MEGRGRRGPTEGLVVAHLGPQSSGAALAPGEHRNNRLVAERIHAGKDVLADLIDQRHQRRRARTDPVGQRGHVEIDAFVGIDVALPVERQMRPVLGEQDLVTCVWSAMTWSSVAMLCLMAPPLSVRICCKSARKTMFVAGGAIGGWSG
jgi:hypothetical protein